MAGFVPGPQATEWGQQRTAIGGEWPTVLVDLDLRYWEDPISCERRNRPSTRQLALTWGWKKSRVDRYLKRDTGGTVDPDTKGPINDDRDTRGTPVGHSRDSGGTTPIVDPARPTPSPSPSPNTTDQNDADGAALPLPIARKLAVADLPTSADELARFPRSTIASADGIGAKSIATIAAWLAGHGVQFRPEPPKAAKRDSKPYTDAWLAAWAAKRSDAYPWDWFRESALLLQVAGVLGNDAARVEAAARAYLAAEASSGVWPHDEPSSVAKFRKTLDKWKTGKAAPVRPVRDEMPASALAKLELMRRLRAERGK